MKRSIFAIGVAAVLLASCATTKNVVQEQFSMTKENREVGYQITNGGKNVMFVFDPKSYKMTTVDRVYVEGSFNGWSKGKDESWKMSYDAKCKAYLLEKDASLVRIPGNSGHPEFKFYIFKKAGALSADEPAAISKTPGYQMATNNLVLFAEDNPQDIVANVKTSKTVKKLADFDLTKSVDRDTLSNFRLVPGTTGLFRGYHPYKKSRGQYDTEDTRIRLIKESFEREGIKSIITLSGNEKPVAGEEISAYQQKIIDAGDNLFVDTSYNTVYFHSAEKEFGSLIAEIVQFINTHPGPYYFHCRLGTDRTGTVSAVLAALVGADWQSIAADYQKTNEMGIQEFRDYHLLQYSFEQMLGKPMSSVANLKAELSSYFVNNGYLTQQDIDALTVCLTKEYTVRLEK